VLTVPDNVGNSFERLVIYTRNGSNTGFTSGVPTTIAVTDSPRGVAIGDLNGDGKADIAFASSQKIHLLYRNAGNTGFDPAVSYTAGNTPSTVVLRDFNGDGKLDLAANGATSFSSFSLLLRTSNNSGFAPASFYGRSFFSYGFVAGDFNGDGLADVAMSDGTFGKVAVNTWDACNTTFSITQDFLTPTAPGLISPWGLVTGDFDGDGRPDLATAVYSTSQISVFTYQNQNLPPVITLAALPTPPVCAGDSLTLTFTKTGLFPHPNCETVTVQLSQVNSSSFASPTVLGTRTQSPAKVRIPVGQAPGTYQVRLVSSSGIISNTRSVTLQSCVQQNCSAGCTSACAGDFTWARPIGQNADISSS
jgi:hypothetical protein